ncbi:MAG: DUF2442 domain-containing protein [Stellaceae bacterium]
MNADTPSITAIRSGKGRDLIVTWKGGAESAVDVAQFVSKHVIFAPLCADDDLFHEVEVGEWGWCVHWSDEMEISADTLRRLALEQGSAWLRDWRMAHRMSQAEAASALGVSARMWRQYEAGSQLLPKTVRLAGIGLDAQAEAA